MALTKIRASSQLLPGSISDNLLDTAFTNRITTIEADIVNINADDTTVGSIDNKVKVAIDALVAGSPDLLNTLNEISAALADDPNFATTITSELALKATTADLNAEITRATGVEGSLVNLDTTDQTNLVSAINEVVADVATNAQAVSDETTRASSAESTLQTNINTTNSNIGTLASLTTDVKTSIVAAVNELETNANTNAANIATNASNIASNTSSISQNTSDIATNASAIATETTNRTNADTALATDITNKIGDGTVDGTTGNTITDRISSAVSTEATARAAADTALDGRVTTLESADTTNTAAIAQNTSDIATNASAITAETTRATGVEGSLASLTTTAQTNLVAAINEVDAHADANASGLATANSNIATNTSNIATNASAISTVSTNVGTLASLTTDAKSTIVAAINEVDANNNTNATAIAANVSTLSSHNSRITAIETDTTIIYEGDIVVGGTVNGTKDGSNTTFTLPNAARPGTITLYINGMANFASANFTVAGDNLTLTLSEAPASSDSLAASYIKVAS